MRSLHTLIVLCTVTFLCAPAQAEPGGRSREHQPLGRMSPAYHASIPDVRAKRMWIGLGGPGVDTKALLDALEAVAPVDALIVVPEMATGDAPDRGAFLPADEVKERTAEEAAAVSRALARDSLRAAEQRYHATRLPVTAVGFWEGATTAFELLDEWSGRRVHILAFGADADSLPASPEVDKTDRKKMIVDVFLLSPSAANAEKRSKAARLRLGKLGLQARVFSGRPAGRSLVEMLREAAWVTTGYQCYDLRSGAELDLDGLVAELAEFDVVFLGETHDNPVTHRLEARILEALHRASPKVALGMEMFERDAQGVLDRYLRGEVSEETFRSESRPWPKYQTDYRPLIEFAKAEGIPVIAGNVPRRLAKLVSRKGSEAALESMSPTDRGYVARKAVVLKDGYRRKFFKTMGAMLGDEPDQIQRIYEAQCIKDDTMAESAADFLKEHPDARPFLHVNGGFHSDDRFGAAQKLGLLRPDLKIAVISAVPSANPRLARPKDVDEGLGDFVIFVPQTPPDPRGSMVHPKAKRKKPAGHPKATPVHPGSDEANEVKPGDFSPLPPELGGTPARPAHKPPGHPWGKPSGHPSGKPPSHPWGKPSGHPSGKPSGHPSGKPPGHPSGKPPGHPSTRSTAPKEPALVPAQPTPSAHVDHVLRVRIAPDEHTLSVLDALTLPAALAGPDGFELSLHAGLSPKAQTPGVTLKLVRRETAAVPVEVYRVTLPPGTRTCVLAYGGVIDHPLKKSGQDYARSFSETPGLISDEGVYLSASTHWYPVIGSGLVTFTLEVEVPETWDAVSQGVRTQHGFFGGLRRAVWKTSLPQDDIYLIAARFKTYYRAAGSVELMAFLRGADEGLAGRYLEATARYLEMYRRLLGPYPYAKFALVENFWETGYGMPSFTLLGPKIIRFPFILHSSYPHEILHNWWGNGVFVDASGGNWCEGLTAYLADHLIQEQRGKGHLYRRNSLQAYTDYAAEKGDFPLAEFRSRHSSATQAVGYGKCLMLFHMLRRRLGDREFVRALRRFYRKNKGKKASFADVEKAFQSVTDEDLSGEFEQWVRRAGAPALRIGAVQSEGSGSTFRLSVTVDQVQSGPPYVLHVPIAIDLQGESEARLVTLEMTRRTATLQLDLPARPTRVRLDPELDVFRLLDRAEIPPALSQLFGAKKVLIVWPADAPAPLRDAYQALAKAWSGSQSWDLLVRSDAEVTELPRDRAVWLLGWENKLLPAFRKAAATQPVEIAKDRVRFGDADRTAPRSSVIVTARHPADPALAVAWVATANPKAVPGLARKLPHYGKYSYLAFSGDAPDNFAKGQWPVVRAPTVRLLGKDVGASAKLPKREALAELPPAFDPARLKADVAFLAAPEQGGRGFGSEGLERSAAYIARAFEEAGLKPGGDDGGWFQTFPARGGDPVRDATLKNVIGVLPGTNAAWKGQSALLTAHYDHLGYGWPDPRKNAAGKLHPGADDNASGVAVLLELARAWGSGWRPARTVILVAFAGEEAGLLGSRHYVKRPGAYPVQECIGVINLDTVGRLEGKKLLVLGTGTAREWSHIFRGVGFVTGVESQRVKDDPGASDQVAFHEAGVPAVQLFSGANADYHRPGDAARKIDIGGLVKVATLAKEAVEYLAAREEAMHSSLKPAVPGAAKKPSPRGSRRVSLGTIPEFGFQGEGVLLSGTVEGSPAEAAGLREGDVLLAVDGTPIGDLRAYSDVLKTVDPGQRLRIRLRRDGEEIEVELTAAAR